MGLTKDRDGEFWMSLEDFQACWSKLEVLRLTKIIFFLAENIFIQIAHFPFQI